MRQRSSDLGQLFATWRLIVNGSMLLKILIVMALISPFLVIALPEQRVTGLLRGWGAVMLALVSLLLITNAARLADNTRAQLLPRFRANLVFVLIAWFIFVAIYICVVEHLGRATFSFTQESVYHFMIIVMFFLVLLTIALCVDKRAVPLILVTLIMYLGLLTGPDMNGLPDWFAPFIYANRENMLLAVPVISASYLLFWTFSSEWRPQIFTALMDSAITKVRSVNLGSRVYDISALFVVRRNQGLVRSGFYWSLIFAGAAFLGIVALPYQLLLADIGIIIFAELCLISELPDSIYHLRQLWLKSQGDREALYKIWETKKLKEVLFINTCLLAINLFFIWWYSLSLELGLFLICSAALIAIFTLYAKALASACYLDFVAVLSVVFVPQAILIIGYTVIATQPNMLHLFASGVVWVLITMLIRLKLKPQVLCLDWSLMPRPVARYALR